MRRRDDNLYQVNSALKNVESVRKKSGYYFASIVEAKSRTTISCIPALLLKKR